MFRFLADHRTLVDLLDLLLWTCWICDCGPVQVSGVCRCPAAAACGPGPCRVTSQRPSSLMLVRVLSITEQEADRQAGSDRTGEPAESGTQSREDLHPEDKSFSGSPVLLVPSSRASRVQLVPRRSVLGDVLRKPSRSGVPVGTSSPSCCGSHREVLQNEGGLTRVRTEPER